MEQSATNQKKPHRDAAEIEKQLAALIAKDESIKLRHTFRL